MEPVQQLFLFKLATAILVLLWFIQVVYIFMLINANRELKLIEKTLSFSSSSFEAVKNITDSISDMHEEISIYNDRLHFLNEAVRIKVQRLDRN